MKRRILFVDDEANVIRGLRRTLFPLKDSWDMFFSGDADEAIRIIKEKDIQLVVCEMKVYASDKRDFIEIVKDDFPEIIRFVLSGYSDEKTSMQAMKSAHQYLLKPSDVNLLKDKIDYSIGLVKYVKNKELQKFLNGVNELPILPQVYFELEKELNSEMISNKKIGEMISGNPSLVTKILQLVNSAFFGLSSKIIDVTQAINILGLNVIKSLVIYLSLLNNNQDKKVQAQQFEIWQHSLKMANIAKSIAKAINGNNFKIDEVYVSGLLHDIGKIVMLQYPGYMKKIVENTQKLNVSYYDAEKIVYKTTHAEIGSYLLGLWGLPEKIVEGVAQHHEPVTSTEKFSMYNILKISEKIARIETIKENELMDIFLKNVEG